MPIYEYQCSACHVVSDVLQKVSEAGPEACPKCGAKGSLSRQVSRTSFVLKGGGWYSDLYGSTKKPEAAGGSEKGKGESSGESSKGSASPADSKATGESSKSSGSSGDPKKSGESKGSGGSEGTKAPASAPASSSPAAPPASSSGDKK